MATTRKGPFTFKWGENLITNVDSIETDIEQDSEDYTKVTGESETIDGVIRAAVALEVSKTDIPVLAALLPQYFVANGEVMSTGETVTNANGAIDVRAASCDTTPEYNNLDIESCGTGDVFRLVNARSRIDSLSLDDKRMTVTIRFIGEPASGEANYQFFIAGSLSVIS